MSELQKELNKALACLYSVKKLEEKKPKKNIYRKLKDYICKDDNVITSVFGNLDDPTCLFTYLDEKGNVIEYSRVYQNSSKYQFLLDYYVAGIWPKYKIIDDKIKPYLKIYLKKRIEEVE
jgi:hypothetical protein